MSELNRKIGTMEYDGLVIDTTPAVQTGGGTIRKGKEATVLKRGTILAKSSTDGKLVVLGSQAQDAETLEAYGILCDDIEVGTEEDVTTAIFTAGCFNGNKVIVEDEYTISSGDLDNLRKYNIVIKYAAKA